MSVYHCTFLAFINPADTVHFTDYFRSLYNRGVSELEQAVGVACVVALVMVSL